MLVPDHNEFIAVDQIARSLVAMNKTEAMIFKLGCLIVQCQYVILVDLGITESWVKGIMPLIRFSEKHNCGCQPYVQQGFVLLYVDCMCKS